MTEEIIIDGVNVAGCNYAITPKKQCPEKPMYYAKETSCIACKEHNTKLNFCKNNKDCYYKQLQCLKQENKKLKENLDDLTKDLKVQNDIIGKFEKALEEIRNIILTYESKEWNCFNDMDVKLKEISKVINEVLV